jgi:hypothetical protein
MITKVYLTFAFILISLIVFPRKLKVSDVEIRIYAVSWNTKYKLARTTENIKKTHLYYFKSKESWVNIMFDGYKDCIQKLSNRKEIERPENYSGSKVKTRLYVEILFNPKKIIKIYFDNEGNYYFMNKWYVKNNGLYYLLFNYFSDEIIPETTLNSAKNNFKNEMWDFN